MANTTNGGKKTPRNLQLHPVKKDEEIKSADIKTEEDDDSMMPQPETKEYKRYLKVTPKFKELFYKCVNTMPYNTIIENAEGKRQKLSAFVKYVETNWEKIAVEDMNNVLSYIARMNFQNARPLMEIVENSEMQGILWGLAQ